MMRGAATLPKMRAPGWTQALAVVLLGLALLFLQAAAPRAQSYPALTGRIVDEAGVIPAAAGAAVEPKLAELERKSGIQFVVATVKSLGGGDIETYANNLFRAWKLGEKDKNNGVLLLIAPNERRVRIEVGYGLEGTLTDALSQVIITNAIAPRFKANDFGGGVERGVDDIITVLTTDSAEWGKRPDLRLDSRQGADDVAPYITLLIFIIIALLIFSARFRQIVAYILLNASLGSGSSGGSWRSGSSGGSWSSGGSGGFSGGGGSSGGGGASGSW
jgi:uncharacterized protein